MKIFHSTFKCNFKQQPTISTVHHTTIWKNKHEKIQIRASSLNFSSVSNSILASSNVVKTYAENHKKTAFNQVENQYIL